MRILTAEFIRSCAGPEQFLKGELSEVAFIGRSNVGKSSLINSLLQRKGLAKVSRTPGKTRLVNLFRITSDDSGLARFVLVDLPGYGYAKVSKALRAEWAPLIEQYLDGSEQLRAVVVLVESRVLSEQDRETIALSSRRPPGGIGNQPSVPCRPGTPAKLRNHTCHSRLSIPRCEPVSRMPCACSLKSLSSKEN